jgi:hypothetical protein
VQYANVEKTFVTSLRSKDTSRTNEALVRGRVREDLKQVRIKLTNPLMPCMLEREIE